MLSFRRAYIPQCGGCGEAAPGPGGGAFFVKQTLLPQDARDALAAAGWAVVAGSAAHDLLLGDKLSCPACEAQREQQVRAHRDWLQQTPVDEVDMSGKLGAGWTLRQREGDAERQRWLVAYRGEVRGTVHRYRRRGGEWSRGWVAEVDAGDTLMHLSAVAEGCLHRNTSFLWRSRDLAAWGVAKRPAFDAPRPEWARRKKKT